MMIAGEVSGDHYGGGLIRKLRDRVPDIRIAGMGGECMHDAGMEVWQDFRGMDVMGFWDVIKKYSEFKRLLRRLIEQTREFKPDRVILIDYAGFNIRFAQAMHELGIPVYYFISPKVWAWNSGRIKKLAAYCTAMLVFFEFEIDVYASSGLPVYWIGHPLLEELQKFSDNRNVYRTQLGVSENDTVIGILPGSRHNEIKHMLPIMMQAFTHVHAEQNCVGILGCAPTVSREELQEYAHDSLDNIRIVHGLTHELMAASNAMMITSGTATLEAGIIGVPHVLCYKMGWLNYQLAKRLVKTDNIGMVNIAMNERIVPELVQGDLTPDSIVYELTQMLDAEAEYREKLKRLRQRLHKAHPLENAARIIVDKGMV